MSNTKSSYQITISQDGKAFTISRGDEISIKPVTYRYEGYGWSISEPSYSIYLGRNLFALHDIVSDICGKVCMAWNKHREKTFQEYGRSPFITQWVNKKIRKRIMAVVYPVFMEILTKNTPAEVLKVAKRYTSQTGFKSHVPKKLLDETWLASNPYFVKDLMNYAAVSSFIRMEGRSWDGNTNWKEAFASEPYHALNVTLHNLKRGFPEIQYLRTVKLPEPITDRLKLRMICVWSGCNLDCLYKSDKKKILKTFKRFKADQERLQGKKLPKLTLRSKQGIMDFCRYLVDFPETHNGDIMGLYHKSYEWHAQFHRENANRRKEEQKTLPGKTPTVVPPFGMPKIDGITFLNTVKAVRDEGQRMGHCIAGYAKQAVQGKCFLFHCEYQGELASIMLNERGDVVQSYGPRNCHNKASAYASSKLVEWTKKKL